MERSDATEEKWNPGNIQEKETELKDGELKRWKSMGAAEELNGLRDPQIWSDDEQMC